MRLPRRVQMLLAGFFALVVVAVAVDIRVLAARDDASAHLQRTLEPARLELRTLLTALVDQETGERGYLLTGDERFLEPYVAGEATAADALARLRELLDHDDDLLAGVDRIASRVEAWQQLGADFEIAAKRDGRDSVVAALVASGSGSELFSDLRVEIDDTKAAIDEAAAHERDEVDRLDGVLLVVDLATLLLTAGLLLVTAVLARAWFTRPLQVLAGSVQDVAAGALHSTVTASGPPEFSELAADVDAMRRRILAEVEEAERAREALADRGMVVLTLRDELTATTTELPDGVTIAHRFAAAQGIVAGDWLDVVRVDGKLGVALVDVSGHGAGVGAFALRTKALTMAALQSHDPGDALAWVAERLGDTGEQFLTGIALLLDPRSGEVLYASAGHPPALLGGLTGISQLPPTGPLLGPLPGAWETASLDLPRGGVLVLYSDGLIEARDQRGVPFGIDQLVEIVERAQLGGPDAVADACLRAVQEHQVTREDDLTLCVVSR